MTNLNLNNAIVYDIETFPNCFTFAMEFLNSDQKAVWEISEFRDDRQYLLQFFNWLAQTQTVMIGFNNLNFDYVVCHFIWKNPNCTYQQIYQKAIEIINSFDRGFSSIWASERFAPQLDLFKMHHLDNKAKMTSLKALQINMRLPTVQDMPIENGTVLTKEQIDNQLVPYNCHDVSSTKRFAEFSADAIAFRISLCEQFGVDVLNWNDTKIGEQTVIQRLGDDLCYDRSSGRRRTRQTPRQHIYFKDIIFPYVKFSSEPFNRVLDILRSQVLSAQDFSSDDEGKPIITTKGVFTDLSATLNGVTYSYGVGGIHGSVERKRIFSGNGYRIRDIDVASLYPSIAIVNNLAPEHLGAPFVQVYSSLPKERKKWQKEKGKKCTEANALKLASNGVYGKSNSVFSPFYDPQFTMSVTINGQLLLSMLIERLVEVPTLQIIQANTDGVTYYIHDLYEKQAALICREWESITGLVLEDAEYAKMFIRDVNNYIAVGVDGSVKLKGAYWTPDPCAYHKSIAEQQPPAWHKNFSNVVSVRAAVANMIYGTDIETFIKSVTNPYDFLCGVKIQKTHKLLYGDKHQQRNTRFYISLVGESLVKLLPAKGKIGCPKKANGVSDKEYLTVMQSNGWQWDRSVCTLNKSVYQETRTEIVAGYKSKICNNIEDFDWKTINYEWYITEAKKLVI